MELDIKVLGLQVDPSPTKDRGLRQLEDPSLIKDQGLQQLEDPVMAVEGLQVLKSMDHLLEEVIVEVTARDDKDRQQSLKVTESTVEGRLMTTMLKLTTAIKDLILEANKALVIIKHQYTVNVYVYNQE